MKKLFTVFTLICAFALLTAACTGNKPKEVTKSAAEIYTLAAEAGKFGVMTPVPAADLTDIYGIDASKLEEHAWYMSENPSLNADEIGIFKVNDAAYANTLAGILNDRIARQLNVAETYSPEEAAKLKNAQAVAVGSWVYFCVGSDNAAIMNVLRNEIG